jgi:Guanylylate cyclase
MDSSTGVLARTFAWLFRNRLQQEPQERGEPAHDVTPSLPSDAQEDDMQTLEFAFDALLMLSSSARSGGSGTTNSNDAGCPPPPAHGVTELVHIRQHDNWDCGIVCLQMIASSSGSTTSTKKLYSREWMLQQIGTQSIWTVDLVLLLCEMQYSPLVFCSQTFAVNPSLRNVQYYQPSFAKDRVRVQNQFERLRHLSRTSSDNSAPVLVQVQHLALQRISECVRHRHCVAIALVDNQILLRDGEDHRKTGNKQRRTGGGDDGNDTDGSNTNNYMGHYIVLAGIVEEEDDSNSSQSPQDGTFVAYNPGSDAPISWISFKTFERAWRALGTDQDIVFVGIAM